MLETPSAHTTHKTRSLILLIPTFLFFSLHNSSLLNVHRLVLSPLLVDMVAMVTTRSTGRPHASGGGFPRQHQSWFMRIGRLTDQVWAAFDMSFNIQWTQLQSLKLFDLLVHRFPPSSRGREAATAHHRGICPGWPPCIKATK